ncbi:UNVERIFIED_CONTAM: hypothetical protein K2H54_065960, partial [Gekko kuhli]
PQCAKPDLISRLEEEEGPFLPGCDQEEGLAAYVCCSRSPLSGSKPPLRNLSMCHDIDATSFHRNAHKPHRAFYLPSLTPRLAGQIRAKDGPVPAVRPDG